MDSGTEKSLNLQLLFNELNQTYFDGFLDPIALTWNSRLRSSAGRFIPGSRKWIRLAPPRIEIASYLAEQTNALALIRDTLGHEMIHYWLWVRKRPYGHTPEFYVKMKKMGVSRYNTVPRSSPKKGFLYQCPTCTKTFKTRRRMRKVFACAQCCREYSDGKFDSRFSLVFLRILDPTELVHL